MKQYIKSQQLVKKDQEILDLPEYSQIVVNQNRFDTLFQQSKNPKIGFKNIDLEYFFRMNSKLVNSYFLDNLLINYLGHTTINLTRIDFSKNMQLNEGALIRFFYNIVGTVNQINLSQTYANLSVIISILTNNKIRYLQTIIFDGCAYLDYQKSIQEILKCSNHSSLRKQQIFQRYKNHIDNQTFMVYCKYVLNRSFQRDLSKNRVGYFSIFDRIYQKSHALLKKATKSNLNKSQFSKILDLSGSKLNLTKLKYSVGLQTIVRIINFSKTPITDLQLYEFFNLKLQPQIKQRLRYLWIENTHLILDNREDQKWEQFFDQFPLKDFNFNEFLYSKGDIALAILSYFSQSKNRNLKLQNSIQFEMFPLIQKDIILQLLKQQQSKRNNTINQISLSFNIENGEQYDGFRTEMNSSLCKSIKGIVVKSIYRGSVSFSDQDCPPYILNELVNPFKGLNLNLNDAVKDLIKYTNFNSLRILDLSQSIISLDEIKEFFESIDIRNQIEEINISNHQIITDQVFDSMIYRVDAYEMDKISQSNKQYSAKKSSMHQLQQQDEAQKSLSNISFNENTNNIKEDINKPDNPINEEEDQENKERVSVSSSQAQTQRLKVFPNLIKLSIEKTSLTQQSLQQILKENPFNQQFDAEYLLQQYTSLCKVSDSTISILAKSIYLRNFEVLNLSQCYFSCDSLLELINSPHCLNIRELNLNCQYLNESIFITLAKTKNFPSLVKVLANNYEQCYSSLGYLAQAKFFDINFDLEQSTLLKEKLIYQSNKFINTIIGSIYMKNVKELHFDNMNDYMTSLKEFFQLAKYCINVESIKLTNIIDKKKYYFMWKELSDSKCFPNLVSIQIDNIKFSENLHALLEQKNKPFIQLDKLLQNQKLINSKTLEVLARQQSLLNSSTLQIYSLTFIYLFFTLKYKVDFDKFVDIFEQNRYLFNITNIELYDFYLSNKKKENTKKPTQVVDQFNFYDITPGYLRKLDNYHEPENLSDTLKSISKCFPNLQRVQLQDIKIQDENEDLFEVVNFLMESYKDQLFSVNFEVITLLNELAEQNIRLPDIKRKLFLYLLINHKYQGKQMNLSFINLCCPDHKEIRSFMQNIDLGFVSGLTFMNTLQFAIYSQNLFNLKLQNLKQITVLDRQVKIFGFSEDSANVKSKINELFEACQKNQEKESSICKLLLQSLTRAEPSHQYLYEYIRQQQNSPEVEVILFPNSILYNFTMTQSNYKPLYRANVVKITLVQRDQEIDEKIMDTFIQNIMEANETQDNCRWSKIIVKVVSGGGEYKIQENLLYELCQKKMLAFDFDINEFTNNYVQFSEDQISSSQIEQFMQQECVRNLQILMVPIIYAGYYSSSSKTISLSNCFGLKKIIVKYYDEPLLINILTQLNSRPSVQVDMTKCVSHKSFSNVLLKSYPRQLKSHITQAFELDSQEQDPKKKINYKNFIRQFFYPRVINFVTSLNINHLILNDIATNQYKIEKAVNLVHVHFEYIPNYENSTMSSFFKNLESLQSVSFDRKKIEQSKIYHNEGQNKQRQQKKDNPLEVLLCLFKGVQNVRIIQTILNEFSSLINSNVLQQIPKIDISSSLTKISFFKNQNFEPISVKENIKKLIQQRITLIETQKLQQQQNEPNFKQNNKQLKEQKLQDGKVQNKKAAAGDDNNDQKKGDPSLGKPGFKNNVNNVLQAASKNKKNNQGELISDSPSDSNKIVNQLPLINQNANQKDIQLPRESITNSNNVSKSKKDKSDRKKELGVINDDIEIQEEGQQKQFENYNQSTIDNIIDEEQLKDFISYMPSLAEIDFSNSSIKHEHVDKLKQVIRFEQTTFINFDQCFNLSRVGNLIQIISENINQSFQFDKFLENLPYNHIKTRKQVKKTVENILKNPFFKKYMRYLNLGFIKKIQSKQISSDCFKGVFDPILNMSDLNINMTAFLQSLPQEIKQHVSDEFIKFLTEQYSPIQFIQPEHFSQVQYAFNYIIQQPNIENEIRIMYLLNPRFQKSISASSFRLIYESILIKKDQINSQIKYIQLELQKFQKKTQGKEKQLVEIKKSVEKYQEEMEKLKNKKREENQNKIRQQIVPNENKKQERQNKDRKKQQFQIKNIERKNSQSELNDSNHMLIDNNKMKEAQIEDIFKFETKQEQAVYKFLIDKRFDRFQERIVDQKRQSKLSEQSKEESTFSEMVQQFTNYLLKKKEFDNSILIFNDIKKDYRRFCIQYSKLPQKEKDEKLEAIINKYNEFLKQNNADEEKKDDDQENKEKDENGKQIDEEEEERKRKEKEKQESKGQWKNQDNKKTLQFGEEIDITQFSKTNNKMRINQKIVKKSTLKHYEEPDDVIIKEVTQTISNAHKRFNERSEILQEINQIKNSDQSSSVKQKKLMMKIHKYKSQIELLNQEQLKLIKEKQKEKNDLIDQDILFELFDSLNLSYNQYFNQLGLNKFILSYINPWMNINLNFEEIQTNKLINLKILSRRNFSNSVNAKIMPQNITNSQNVLQQQQIQNGPNILQQKMNEKQMLHNTQLNDQIQNIVRANHLLDDAIIKDLITLISSKMHKVRKIHLSGLNVGDEFAEQFSLILSSSEQLQHLKRIQLYHNRRISSFGLKFLFSSIVERIPYGFKIDISPSLYDFESLKKSLFLLEREFITKLIRISSAKLSQSEKDLLQFINAITKINEDEKKKKSKIKTPKPLQKINTIQGTDEQKDKPLGILKNEEKLPLTSTNKDVVGYNDIDNIEKMVKEAVLNNKQEVNIIRQNNKKMSLSEIDENDFMEFPNPNNTAAIKQEFTKKDDEAKDDNYDEDEDEDEQQDDDNDEDYEYEDMVIQMKQVDQKESILDWNFLSYEGKLNKKLVEQFLKKYKNEGQALINRIVSYRKKYEKSLIQIKAQKLEEEDDDVTVMIQNLVNEGLYDTINFIFSKQWSKNRLTCVLLALILFPFSLFHYIQLITHKFNDWINNFQFDEFFKEILAQYGNSYSAEITKIVPKTIGSQDFYFDEDVARLNSILAQENTENNERRQDLVVYKKYLNNPAKHLDILKGYQPKQKNHILRLSKYIFIVYFFLFQVGVCFLWPLFLVTKLSKDHCESLYWYYDVPFYFMSMLYVFIEFAMLSDLEYVISVKQIFSLKSSLAIALTYSSFMARYDQYTDSLFAFKTLTCDTLHQRDHRIYYIGIASTIIMALNMLFQYYGFGYELFQIYIKKHLTHYELHNTNYINQYTKIALISEFYGVGISLDRFSTSSANNLDYWFIPKVLRSVKIPQIFQSKFQRVFIEDIPMIAILFIYNTYYLTDQWYRWDNLKVILTTILNLYHSLHQAWIARPSIFRTYQMQEYLEFREKHSDIYRLKVYSKDFQPIEFDLQQLKQCFNEFKKKYPNFVIQNNKDAKKDDKKDKVGLNKESQSEQKSKGKSENQSQRSGNSSRKDNEKYDELHESQSKQSHDGDEDSHNMDGNQIQNTDKKKKVFESEMKFKEEIFKFIINFHQQQQTQYKNK